MNIADFLLARIAEEEAAHGHYKVQPSDWGDFTTPDGGCVPCDLAPPRTCRVLAECAAKRRIVEKLAHAENHVAEVGGAHLSLDGLRFAARALAAVYADHPDYREEWSLDPA